MVSKLRVVFQTYTFGLLMTRYKFSTANQTGVINVINSSQDSLLNFRRPVLEIENVVTAPSERRNPHITTARAGNTIYV
jgi:hypothetical protein